MHQKMEEQLMYAKQHRSEYSLIFFDIDHFKEVNDTYGHDFGDSALKDISALVTEHLRKGDVFARWGGEEFIISLANTSHDQAIQLAEKLRHLIFTHSFDHGELSCSFGVATLGDEVKVKDLVKKVDLLLYKAKENVRNKVMS
jgi:diguanylate cyclase (GGDEF)-like protein